MEKSSSTAPGVVSGGQAAGAPFRLLEPAMQYINLTVPTSYADHPVQHAGDLVELHRIIRQDERAGLIGESQAHTEGLIATMRYCMLDVPAGA